jgi:vesicle coat complex subunit
VQETTLRTKALLDNMYMKTLTLLKQHHAALTKAVYVSAFFFFSVSYQYILQERDIEGM